jgi:CheY-like chemotaxis protein
MAPGVHGSAPRWSREARPPQREVDVDDKEHRRRAYALRERMIAMPQPLVLVAEDDDDVRRLVTTALRMDGHSVIEARDGNDLVEHIGSALLFGHVRGELDPVAMVISDIRMPGPSGLEVLAQLRRSDIDVAIILMSAHADPATRAEAQRLGADAFVAKPFEIDDLRGVVRELLAASAHG